MVALASGASAVGASHRVNLARAGTIAVVPKRENELTDKLTDPNARFEFQSISR